MFFCPGENDRPCALRRQAWRIRGVPHAPHRRGRDEGDPVVSLATGANVVPSIRGPVTPALPPRRLTLSLSLGTGPAAQRQAYKHARNAEQRKPNRAGGLTLQRRAWYAKSGHALEPSRRVKLTALASVAAAGVVTFVALAPARADAPPAIQPQTSTGNVGGGVSTVGAANAAASASSSNNAGASGAASAQIAPIRPENTIATGSGGAGGPASGCVDEALKEELVGGRHYRGVQDRLFTKALRHELSGFGGIYAADLYSSNVTYGGAYTFHFSEDLALEASMMLTRFRSQVTDAYEQRYPQVQVEERTDKPGRLYFGHLIYSFAYGKLRWAGGGITHFDFNVALGAGITDDTTSRGITGSAGLGTKFYFGDWFALRVDIRDHVLSESLVGEEHLVNDVIATAGFSIFIPFTR